MTYFQKVLEFKLKYQVDGKNRTNCKMITSISFLNFQKDRNLINIINK